MPPEAKLPRILQARFERGSQEVQARFRDRFRRGLEQAGQKLRTVSGQTGDWREVQKRFTRGPGQVHKRFRTGLQEVQDRFTRGSGQVYKRFRTGLQEVQDRFTRGSEPF